MSLFLSIRNFLADPRLKGIDLNSDDLTNAHQQILSEKKMLRDVFAEFYHACINYDKKFFSGIGKRIEIGAGTSLFKKYYPKIFSTDIKIGPNIDLIVDAQNMPFETSSVHAIYGIHCFHHLPNPDKFFDELKRVLVSGGGCILIEPYYGFVARRFFKHLFDTECFEMYQTEWETDSLGIMTGVNQALSYIIFKRDIEKFKQKFPEFEIVLQKPLRNYIRYLFSGGLNYRQLLPGFFSPVLKGTEFIILPLTGFLALHHIIVIRKKYFDF